MDVTNASTVKAKTKVKATVAWTEHERNMSMLRENKLQCVSTRDEMETAVRVNCTK